MSTIEFIKILRYKTQYSLTHKKALLMNYQKGILGVFNLIWKRRKYSSFYETFHSNYFTENECDEIYNNLRKTWMRTVLWCLIIIAIVWAPYYFFEGGIFTISLSSLITIISVGVPIILWFVFDSIENAINKHIRNLRIKQKQTPRKKGYDDFDFLGV